MNDAAHRAGSANVAPVPIAPGAILAGRFRLEQTLGSGGMAEVWRAFDIATQRPVAVKLLRAQVAGSAEAVSRLKREGEVLSALSHPAIVRVETYGQLDGGMVFLAMELLEGETLGARMRRGLMQPVELAPVVAGTCAALAAAHGKSIVHRDLKPDNIFLVPLPGSSGSSEPQVKLLDFGISKVYGGTRLTYTGEILGTPRYMSPEQLGAEPDIDPRVDVYALGVIAYEALAGKPPFLASTPTDLIVAILHGKIAPLRSLRPDLSPAMEAVVTRAMARAREARYARAADFADAFLEAAGATARARALPRGKVMQTQALGGAGLVPGSVPPPPDLATAATAIELPATPSLPGSDPDVLRPGTFSAFDAVDESAVRSARPREAATLPAMSASAAPHVATASASSHAASASASSHAASASASPHAASASASPQAPPAHAPRIEAPHVPAALVAQAPSAAPPSASESWRERPDGGWGESLAPAAPRSPVLGRVLLVLAGLLAGALSAAIAIVALQHYWREQGSPPAPAAPTPPTGARPSPTPSSEVASAAGDDATSEVEAPATALAAPEGADGVSAEVGAGAPVEPAAEPDRPPVEREREADDATASARATARPRARGRRAGRGSPEARAEAGESAADPDREPNTAGTQWPARTDPIEAASRALAEGDADECIAILDDLIGRGATPFAFKRRADCLMRAGRRADAIRDYQRFCQVAPDHPAVATVREQLAGMGLTCP